MYRYVRKARRHNALARGDKQIHSTVATVCDPRSNLRVFDQIWPAAKQAKLRRRARAQFQRAHDNYKRCVDQIEVPLPRHKTTCAGDTAGYVDSDDDLYTMSQRSTEAKWKRWIAEPGIGHYEDIMQF